MNNGETFLHLRFKRMQHGFILIASLFMLLLMSILTISMSGSFGLQELIAGNQNEKVRAIESAQSALGYAEWWLNQTTAGASNAGVGIATGAGCTSAVTTATSTPTPVICCNTSNGANTCSTPATVLTTSLLTNPTTLPWTTVVNGVSHNVGVSYQPPNMTISTTGGIGTFYAIPKFYIQYLAGGSSNPNFNSGNGFCNMYQITAMGYGGDASSIAVLQSVYQMAC